LCHLLLGIDHRGINLGAIYWLVSGPYSTPTPRAANRARPIWKSITFDAPPRAAAAMRRGAPRGECEGEHGEPYCFGKNKGGATHGGPDGYGGWADVDIS
jgi:hypothetical protein